MKLLMITSTTCKRKEKFLNSRKLELLRGYLPTISMTGLKLSGAKSKIKISYLSTVSASTMPPLSSVVMKWARRNLVSFSSA